MTYTILAIILALAALIHADYRRREALKLSNPSLVEEILDDMYEEFDLTDNETLKDIVFGALDAFAEPIYMRMQKEGFTLGQIVRKMHADARQVCTQMQEKYPDLFPTSESRNDKTSCDHQTGKRA